MEKIKDYIKIEAIISAAFNFFINGMIAALIHHKADTVPTDTMSVAIDLVTTCIGICIFTAFFNRASIKRNKAEGCVETNSRVILFCGKLFRCPVLFGIVIGILSAAILLALTSAVFVPLGILSIPFGVYITLKCSFTALFGGGVTILELYADICKR